MAITNGYATLNEVKAAARITDSVDDALLELSVESASRQIDRACDRIFYNAGTATRVFLPTDPYLTEIDDLVSVSSIKTSSAADGNFDVTWTSTDYELNPLNGRSGGSYWPYTDIKAIGDYLFPVWTTSTTNSNEATVQVTGVWGWSAVPIDIKQATILLAMRQFKRYDSPLGVAGFGDIGAIRVGRIDPDVDALIHPFKKISAA
jgi:hypothetical protein